MVGKRIVSFAFVSLGSVVNVCVCISCMQEYGGCLVFLILVSSAVGGLATVFSVVDHGAMGDGMTDDLEAFKQTWSAVCGDLSTPTFLVPAGMTFLLSKVSFSGPCNSPILVQIDGTIVALNNLLDTDGNYWINFEHVDGLSINGSGKIDGQGEIWWNCKRSAVRHLLPHFALSISGGSNFTLSGLDFTNSQQKHIGIYGIVGVQVHGINITAPGDSPNTDGIYIRSCQHVTVSNSTIGTGDDCISIGNGTSDVNITQITCGPGHGISIGSLGEEETQAAVEQVHVSSCNFWETQNGVRIKTWQGGSGYARNITFENINFTAVYHPIIIDQYYCNGDYDCPNMASAHKLTSAVQVSDVHYIRATGTSSSDMAISLNCSQTIACTGITIDGVDIQPADASVKAASFCYNAQLTTTNDGVVPEISC
ncbi:unnamed protein product [Musa acuminata subsp. malaccensis]|uniref:(wild Malaysian banana) hypothetical protein n=1 Tax=Musa acuminata subsp. malaccensis TaxID=214687 RepID=A0A8D7A3E2_MUSAM|nr:unnamed protein product [Musa acuminata subsp. malaccensis]